MNYASAITGIILAIMLAGSSYADYVAHPRVLEVLDRLEVPRERARTLGHIKVLGALGLLVGIVVYPVGVAASIGLCLYFVIAVAVHSRAGDTIAQTLPVTPFLVLALFGLMTTLAR